jgi:hypothetical protein
MTRPRDQARLDPRARLIVTAACGLWMAIAGVGLALIASHDSKAGRRAIVPAAWSSELGLPEQDGRPLVVVAVHPRCPCTPSTIDAIRDATARAQAEPRIIAIVMTPSSQGPDWAGGESLAKLREIGAQINIDLDGAGAARLGATTSGHVIVFAADGTRVFSGGVTPSRGHVGECNGTTALEASLRGRRPHIAETPVFGCELQDANGPRDGTTAAACCGGKAGPAQTHANGADQ